MDLQTLIETYADGRNNIELARDTLNGTSRETIRLLRSNRARTAKGLPNTETIRGLATALNLPTQTVILASAESLGLCQPDTTTPPTPPRLKYLEEEHTQLLQHAHHLQEQIYYWQNQAATYRIQARTLRHHFQNLQPRAQQRPWLIAGTQHQANHMQANESR